MSEDKWVFEFRYGPFLVKPIGEDLVDIDVDKETFKRLLLEFQLRILGLDETIVRIAVDKMYPKRVK